MIVKFEIKPTIILLYAFFQIIMKTRANSEYLIVKTSSGLVRGKLNEFNGFSYYSFLGIPYAESTAGEFRFMPPVPKKPWSHILDAARAGPLCPQKNSRYKIEETNEDCLFINVYVPANITKKLATFVLIHGGGHLSLSGDSSFLYGPQFILQKEVIFVSMNYRLHALGFLSVNKEDACGNAAIKDIILSLKWINKNLNNFGGDKNKITVFGNSSGAALVQYLILSRKTTGLFQQVIIVSGSAFNHRSLVRYPEDVASLLGNELGIKTNDSTILLQHLRNIDVFNLTEAYFRMVNAYTRIIKTYSSFVPSIDKMCSDPFIDTAPAEILAAGLPQKVPILVGFNTNEGLYIAPHLLKNKSSIKKLNENLELLIPSDIEYPRGSVEAKHLAESITNLYFGTNSIIDDNTFCFMCLIDYISDIQYGIYTLDSWARKYKASKDSNDIYMYEFNFDGALNLAKSEYDIDFPGIAHADELGYLFKMNFKMKRKFVDDRSKQMRETMTTLFTNFVKYGNPTPDKDSDIFWPEYGKEQNYLLINDKSRIMQRNWTSRLAKMNFWDKVYDDYNKYVIRGGKLEKKIIP